MVLSRAQFLAKRNELKPDFEQFSDRKTASPDSKGSVMPWANEVCTTSGCVRLAIHADRFVTQFLSWQTAVITPV